MVQFSRLVEFSLEMVFTEVVKCCEDVVLADLIGLAEIVREVVSQGVVEALVELFGDTRVVLEIFGVLLADLSELLVVSQGTE
jgi:hypothetical protein